MSDLASKECIPCRGGVPALTSEGIEPLLQHIQGWQVIKDHHLHGDFGFPDFQTALDFVNQVGHLAEEQHTLGTKTRLGIFIGYVTDVDGKCKGDALVINAQAFSESYRANGCHVIRTKLAELTQTRWPSSGKESSHGKWFFPVAEGLLRQPDDDVADSRFIQVDKPDRL